MYDDIKIDSGSNSTKSMTLKIKVMKIQAVTLLSDPESEQPEYSTKENYWFYPKSGVVYDYDLHYAVGRVAMDEDKLPIKLDKDTYIIDYAIPIPFVNDEIN